MTRPTLLQPIAASFRLVARNLLVGGFLLVLLDVLQVGISEPAAFASPHRYGAALLPATLLLAAVACVPLVPLRLRLDDHQLAPSIRALVVCIATLLVCNVGSWLLYTRRLQLPLEATLVVGTGVAATILLATLIMFRRRPPQGVLILALLWGTYVAAIPYHRILAQHAIWPALCLWVLAAGIRLPRPNLVAGLAAVMSVAGLIGYEGDRSAVARLVRRSVVAAPLAQSMRSIVDFDSDGFSAILGGGDCDDFDAALSPQELEVVGNGKDDNCLGGDLETFTPVGTGSVGSAQPISPLPDIVIISIDAVRADALTPRLMPNVFALASAGLHAPVAYASAPHTGVSMVSLMTSTYGIDSRRHERFFGYEPHLGLVLRKAGYQSVAVHCLSDLITDMVQGFDFVDNQLGPRCSSFAGTTAKAMGDLVLNYLSPEKRNKPLFLWAHFTDPHLPYHEGYEAEVARVDREVGRIIASLSDNTIVIVVSDHGESFGSHGYRGHIWRLDEEMIRVPLVMNGPGVPSSKLSWPATLLDVAPTLTEILGLPTPVGWQGESLLRNPGTRPIAFESVYHGLVDLHGIRLGAYKLTHDRRHNTFELYNVHDDPDDLHNLAEREPEKFFAMRRELGRVFDELHNDKGVLRKLLLLDSRPNVMPKHSGPLH